MSTLIEETAERFRTRREEIDQEIRQEEAALRERLSSLYEEREELDDALRRLTRGDGRARSASASRTTPSGRAPRGTNKQAILEYVAAHPGSRSAAIAEATGIAKPTTATTLSKMVQSGEVEKRGTEYHPA